MRLGRDGIAGLIGLAVSLMLLPQALGLPKLPIVPVGPGFYPSMVLVFMALTSAALLAQDLLARRRTGPADATAAPPRAYGLVATAFAVVAGYIALMPLIGFRSVSPNFAKSGSGLACSGTALDAAADWPALPNEFITRRANALTSSIEMRPPGPEPET